MLPENTRTTHDTQHSDRAASLDVDPTCKEDVEQREGEAGEHLRPSSGTEASGGGRKPSTAIVGALLKGRRVPLAGQAVGDSGRATKEGEEGREEQNGEGVKGRALVEKGGKRRHAEGGELQTTSPSDHNHNDGADRQPREAGDEHQQRMASAVPMADENGTPTSDTSRSAVEAAQRRVGGEMAEAGEESWTRSSGGEFDGDEAKSVGPTSTAGARPNQHQDADAVQPDPQGTKDGGGRDERSAGRQWARESGVVPVRRRAAEAADGRSLGAGLEFGNSGVWEHMEGEGVGGKISVGRRRRNFAREKSC